MTQNLTDKAPRRWQGHVALLAANAMWGIMSPVTKDVLNNAALNPIALSAIRILGGALMFLLFSLILPASVTGEEKVRRADMVKLLIASVLMISANQGLFIIGIGFTGPIDSAVMTTVTPLLTMVFAAIIMGIPITWMKTGGVALGLAGALLLVVAGGRDGEVTATASNPILGDALCLGAQACAALYYVLFSDIIRRYSPFTLMKWMFVLSALTYVPCTIPWVFDIDWSGLTSSNIVEIAYIIIFPTFIGYMLIPFSQRLLKPTVVSMYNYFQPVTAAIVAVMLGVGEFGPVKIAASAMIFAGVYFVTLNSSRQ